MTGRLAAAAWAAAAGALTGLALLTLFYWRSAPLRIEFAVDPPRLVTGMHRAERDEASGLTFAWTAGDVALRLPGLDRRHAWTLDILMSGGRPSPATNPSVAFFVDGAHAEAAESRTGFQSVRFRIPPRPERPRGLLVTMRVSDTFTPGPADPRALGVMVDRVTLTPDAFVTPAPDALLGAAAAGAALGAAFGLAGPGLAIAMPAAVAVSAAYAHVLARGFGTFTNYPAIGTRLAVSISVSLGLLVLLVEAFRRERLSAAACAAGMLTAAALFLKLAVQLHPEMPLGDALFQAHRFQEVLRGNYYFTSIAPGNYLFPYAPGLYVAASPFGDMVRREAGDVMLLRTVVASTDAVAAILLYTAVLRGWQDRFAAALACAAYQLLPLTFLIASGGTLTSAFAQSVAVIAFVVMGLPTLRVDGPAGFALLTAALLAAFLSHTSTFAILSVSTAAVAGVLAWRGGLPLRRTGGAVAMAGVLAALLAVILYYGHFLETYRTELARIGSETASAAADAGGRSIADRARAVPRYLLEYYALPFVMLGAIGAAALWRRSSRDRLTLAAAGSTVACVLFLGVGVLTPVDMRYYVAALPIVAVAVAAGACALWRFGTPGRLAAAVLALWGAWRGLQTWLAVLG